MYKILIVEDEIDTAKVLEKRIVDMGYEVVVAYDAYGGISYLHREKPDLVILDLMLPAGGGISVLENMRLSAHVSYIPIIVLTAVRDEQYRKKVMDLGVEAYIEKPYDFEELKATVSDILEGQRKVK